MKQELEIDEAPIPDPQEITASIQNQSEEDEKYLTTISEQTLDREENTTW